MNQTTRKGDTQKQKTENNPLCVKFPLLEVFTFSVCKMRKIDFYCARQVKSLNKKPRGFMQSSFPFLCI